jgi:hypothetical protein
MLKGWKTISFNVLMGAILLLNQFSLFGTDPVPSADQVHAGLDSVEQGVAALLVVGNMILRAITNTTVLKKTSPAPMPEA